MDKSQVQQYQSDDGKHERSEALSDKESSAIEEVFPGVPIVRSNTPRPLSFSTLMPSSGPLQALPSGSTFPSKAPSAPPLPEELAVREDETAATPEATAQSAQAQPADGSQEFTWLFEYGLEMDVAVLNSSERLNGQALFHGPALLKGYTLMLGAQSIHGSYGPTIVAIMTSPQLAAEVWGTLYRIPRRLTEQVGDDPSLLDTIHAAIAPQNFFKATQVIVREPDRERDLPCLTYVATDIAYQQLQLVPAAQWQGDTDLVQRLVAIARKYKIPDSYVQQYATNVGTQTMQIASSSLLASMRSDRESALASVPEQDTEPLPAFAEHILSVTQSLPKSSSAAPVARPANRWLLIFASYLVLLLLTVLIFAVLQGLGFGNGVLTSHFTPLGVPWLVMMYGLLGGCISSIVTLGRFRADDLPLFLIVTWFTRPFVGAVLAILAFLLLTSGLFALGDGTGRHMPFFLLIGALAGFCEGWIFVRRSH